MEAPKNRRFYFGVWRPFLRPTNIGERTTFVKSICQKWGAIGNVLQEHIEKLMGILWQPGKTWKQRIWCHFGACCSFSLVACNFYFQSQWSPFSNLANTLAMNCGTLNPNLPPSPQGGPFTPWGSFSLGACKFYSSNWLPLFLAWTDSPSYEHPTYLVWLLVVTALLVTGSIAMSSGHWLHVTIGLVEPVTNRHNIFLPYQLWCIPRWNGPY
jgi:hypothetical protein